MERDAAAVQGTDGMLGVTHRIWAQASGRRASLHLDTLPSACTKPGLGF